MQTPLLLRSHEEGGHRGSRNTYEQFIRRFYYPGAAPDATLLVETCATCQKNKPKPSPQQSVLASSPVGEPFQKWSIDFVGPLPASATGNQYILTAKDCFTRWIEAFPTSDMRAETVAKTLEREIFARYGMPEHIHSDQGTQFTSQLMKEVYKELGILGTHTPPYNPKSNPVERTHRDLGQLLRACVNDHPQDWEDFLPDCLLAMRVAVSQGTGFSPFAMVYGREAVLPLDLVYGRPYGDPHSPVVQVNQLRARLETAFRLAREEQQRVIRRARRLYGQAQPGGPLQEGDKVWMFSPRTSGASRKLATRWSGPWTISKKISPVVFKLKSGPWNQTMVEVTAGLDRLRRCRHVPDDPEVPHDLRLRDVDESDEFQELPEGDGPEGEGRPDPSPAGAGAPAPTGASRGPSTPPAPPAPPAPPPPPAADPADPAGHEPLEEMELGEPEPPEDPEGMEEDDPAGPDERVEPTQPDPPTPTSMDEGSGEPESGHSPFSGSFDPPTHSTPKEATRAEPQLSGSEVGRTKDSSAPPFFGFGQPGPTSPADVTPKSTEGQDPPSGSPQSGSFHGFHLTRPSTTNQKGDQQEKGERTGPRKVDQLADTTFSSSHFSGFRSAPSRTKSIPSLGSELRDALALETVAAGARH